MTTKIKRQFKLSRLISKTIFYLLITTLAVTIILPAFFLVTLSFLSTREAYSYPLPLLPSLKAEYSLTYGERGYLLSVYDNFDQEYQTVLDTSELDKISVYMKSQISTPYSISKLEDRIAELENGPEDIVYFRARKNLWLNYDTFFKITRDAVPALLRSFQIAGLTILVSLSIGGMAGYAFARYIFPGRDALKFSVLFVRMFPGIAIALPMVIILANMGFYDKPVGLVLVYSVGSIALTIWITASIFMGIPESLEEAAQVFGATKFQTFLRITFPLALPGLAAAAMYAFLGAWNETVSAIILTQFNPTFPVVVYQALLGAVGNVNLAAAGGLVMAVPSLIFTFFIRRYIQQMWGGVTI
jgi:multiple sugar transport system permease protein